MRTPQTCLLGCLLLASCDLGGTAAPFSCTDGSVLATDENRHLYCRPGPLPVVAAPSCTGTLTSDGRQIYCTSPTRSADQDADIRTTLTQLDAQTESLARALPPRGVSIRSGFVGTTSTTSFGNILGDGSSSPGLVAAATLCAAEFGAGAHLCLQDELSESVANGTLAASSTLPPSWVYAPNGNNPLASTEQSEQGIADNCQGYTYPLAGRRWVGVLVEWGPLPDGTPGLRWHSGTDAYCTSRRPLACCK